VYAELEEAKKAFPDAYICILGYDNVRQVQCIMFISPTAPGLGGGRRCLSISSSETQLVSNHINILQKLFFYRQFLKDRW